MSPERLLVFVLLWAPAAAALHARWSARLGAGAGYDDNVHADGAGGDALIALTPALGYLAQGRHLRLEVDYDARLWGFVINTEGSAAHQLRAQVEGDVGRHGELRLSERIRYAGDPISLARMGLLGVAQPSLRHVARGEMAWPLWRHTALVLRGRHELVRIFGSGDGSRSHALAPELGARWVASRRWRWELAYRAQIFIGDELTQGAAAEARWRATRRWTLSALGGATLAGAGVAPRARLRAEWLHRAGAMLMTASRDIVVGGWRTGGSAMADQIELELRRRLGGRFTVQLQSGMYRNAASFPSSPWAAIRGEVAGYVVGASLETALGSGFAAVVAAERFAMLWGASSNRNRDQGSVHLVWSTP